VDRNRGAVLGGLALSSAALRNYAITLHAALAPTGVYAGTLTIGGLIERGHLPCNDGRSERVRRRDGRHPEPR